MRAWLPPRALVLSWLGLMILLATTVFIAYQPLGPFNTAIALTIALAKALIVAAVFMELREGAGVTIAFAAAGFFWLGVMIWLAFSDFATRPPPSPPSAFFSEFGRPPGRKEPIRFALDDRLLAASGLAAR